jgi:hypothetical protein
MKRSLCLSLTGLVISCQSASSDSVRCGPGTVEHDHECVPDASDAGGPIVPSADASDDAALEASPPDAGIDAGPIVHDGEPCPTGYGAGGCSGNRIFHCQHMTATDVGTVLFLDTGDCSMLGGVCTTGGLLPHCEGGGYTSCDPAKDVQHCLDSSIVVMCDQTIIDAAGKGRWYGEPCNKAGPSYVCAGGGCAPP